MKRGFVVAAFFLFTVGLFAQVPEKVSGYLGSRISLGVGADGFFCINEHPQEGSTTARGDKVTFNRMFNAHLGYAMGVRLETGFRIGFNKTSVYFDDYRYAGGLTWQVGSTEMAFSGAIGAPGIKDLYLGVYGKVFRGIKGGMAPVGTYIGFGLNLHNYQFDYSTVKFRVHVGSSTTPNIYSLKNPVSSARYPEFFLEYGKAWPLGEFFLLDLSVKSAMLVTGFLGGPDVNADYDLNEFTHWEMRRRLRDMYILNFTARFSLML